VAVGGGTAFAAVEKKPDYWDGIWWAITTMTTVGYGDVPVTTDAGRLIGIIVMLVGFGFGFGSILIGAVAEQFVARDVDTEVEAVEATEEELLRELPELTVRLRRIERAMGRRTSRPS
jgi:voltage-gated potassium channel